MEKIVIGIVAKPQGLKGEIKINPITDDINRFKKLKNIYLNNTKYEVENVSIRGGFVVIKLKNINSIEEVERFRQCNVEIDRDDAVELKENEYFMVDLIGAKLITEDGTMLGTIKYFDKFGSSFVATVTDSISNNEFMFPFINDVLVKVDAENKIVVVDGLKLEEVKVWKLIF